MIVIPWLRQPVGAIRPNFNHSWLKQSTGLWVFSQPYNLITGEPTVLSGTAYFTSSPQGIAARTVSGTNRIQLASDSRNIVPTSGGFTVALHYRKIGAAAATAGFGLDASANAWFRAGTHFPFSDGTLYWDFGGNSAGTSRLTAAGLTYGDDFWVFTAGPRGMEIWQNGIRRSQQASAVDWSSSSNPYLLGMHGTATNSDDAECAVITTCARQWSAAECADWTAPKVWECVEPVVLYISATGRSATATLDAAILESKSATATLNAAIQTSNANTATLDGVISQRNTASSTLNAAIQAGVTASATLNAAIQERLSASSTLDAVISTAGSSLLTATLDAAIREGKSLTATLNAAIQTSGSVSAALNAVVVQVNSATATLDATIRAAVSAFALLDAYIFDADAPVVEETPQGGAGRSKRRRYIMPDDSVVYATPREAEQLVKLFVKPKPEKKKKKTVVKTLNKLFRIEEASSDTVPTERVVLKQAVWDNTDLYRQALDLLAKREITRRRREEELILLAA